MTEAVEQPALRVSVLIPTYNRAEYLPDALTSVFAQTLVPFEILIIDDGSSDDTPTIVRSYEPRVRYYRHARNKGVSEARNTGLSAARGDVIAWLDSDDLWEPEFLATVVPLLAEDRMLAGVYTGVTMIDADGRPLGTSVRVEPPEDLYDALIRANFLATPSFVARKTCYDQTSGFDPQLRISEDYDMWLQLARQFRIVGVPRSLVRIRIHTANTMSDVDMACEARLRLIEKRFGELKDNGTSLPDSAKAAYGYAFRSIALKHIEGGRPAAGWSYLQRAAALHPAILLHLDTFYELACGDQPRGQRGQVAGVDLAARGAEMLRRLGALFVGASRDLQDIRGAAYGNAHLALAMLNDQAGDWAVARRYLLRATRFHPRLLRDPLLVRRFVKLCLGRRVVSRLRPFQSDTAYNGPE